MEMRSEAFVDVFHEYILIYEFESQMIEMLRENLIYVYGPSDTSVGY